MPNYCWNILNINGPEEDINKFLDKSMVKKDGDTEDYFSFSGTVPEPDYETTPVKLTYPEVSAKFAKTKKQKEKIMENKPTIRKDSWWDWRVQNWGTKWEPMDPNIEQGNPEHVQITFDSAWSPPIEWLHKVHLDYPNLQFHLEFEEPGMNFYGYVDAYGKNGIFDEFEDDLDKLHEKENLPVV